MTGYDQFFATLQYTVFKSPCINEVLHFFCKHHLYWRAFCTETKWTCIGRGLQSLILQLKPSWHLLHWNQELPTLPIECRRTISLYIITKPTTQSLLLWSDMSICCVLLCPLSTTKCWILPANTATSTDLVHFKASMNKGHILTWQVMEPGEGFKNPKKKTSLVQATDDKFTYPRFTILSGSQHTISKWWVAVHLLTHDSPNSHSIK